MKMSDVFDLPFTAGTEFQEIYDASGDPLPDFESVEKDKAVVQAINSHDALVDLSKELMDVLVDAASSPHKTHMGGVDIALNPHTADKIIAALNKAEELLKEQG